MGLKDDLGNHLFRDTGIDEIMKDITSDILKQVEDQREAIIRKRLKELLNIEIDIEEEKQRRFKRFSVENNGNEETVYFNDGSVDGVRIVTFTKENTPLSIDGDISKIITEYSYY